MQDDQIYDRLSSVFKSVFNDEDLTLSAEITADDIDEWDSFTHIRLIVEVEKAFGIKFATSDIARFENVGQLAEMIGQKLG